MLKWSRAWDPRAPRDVGEEEATSWKRKKAWSDLAIEWDAFSAVAEALTTAGSTSIWLLEKPS